MEGAVRMSEAHTPGNAGKPGDLLRVSSTARGTTAVVTASGEVDLGTASALDDALTDVESWEPRPTRTVLDMSGVTFVASVGLGVLTQHHWRCAELGMPLVVVTANRTTLRALEITGLTDLLTIVATQDEAPATDS
jgi:anti-sigma B factor antagonist